MTTYHRSIVGRRAEVETLPGGLVDIRLTCMPWEDAPTLERIATAVLLVTHHEREVRVRAVRMTWAEAIARAVFVATVVALLLVAVWGSAC